MGIYFNSRMKRSFTEAIVNGQNQDPEEENEDYTGNDPNTPQANDEPEQGGDTPPEETPTPEPQEEETPEEPEEDYTQGEEPAETGAEPQAADAPPEGEETPEGGETPEEGDTDYTIPDDAEPQEADQGGDTPPEEGGTDYTQDDAPEGGEGTEGEDYTQGGEGDDTSGETGNEGEEPSGEKINNSIKDKEDELFADLTDEQKTIRDTELKGCYAELYNTVNEVIERINNIHKTEYTLDVFEFISNKLNELKSLIHYYLTVTFDTKSYIENQISYQECLAILNTINEMLKTVEKSQNAQEGQE